MWGDPGGIRYGHLYGCQLMKELRDNTRQYINNTYRAIHSVWRVRSKFKYDHPIAGTCEPIVTLLV